MVRVFIPVLFIDSMANPKQLPEACEVYPQGSPHAPSLSLRNKEARLRNIELWTHFNS